MRGAYVWNPKNFKNRNKNIKRITLKFEATISKLQTGPKHNAQPSAVQCLVILTSKEI